MKTAEPACKPNTYNFQSISTINNSFFHILRRSNYNNPLFKFQVLNYLSNQLKRAAMFCCVGKCNFCMICTDCFVLLIRSWKPSPDYWLRDFHKTGPCLLACNPVNPNLTFLARSSLTRGHDQRMNEPWMNPFALAFQRVSVPSYRPTTLSFLTPALKNIFLNKYRVRKN